MLPIVLVHGIARFDIVSEILRRLSPPSLNIFDSFRYFNGIPAHLLANGAAEHVFTPNLDFAAPSSRRAVHLKTEIDHYLNQTGRDRVNIIAHSMGGLDARRMIADLGMQDKVASLTTIGTPHRGTVLADHLLQAGGDGLIREVQKFIRLDLNGCRDLTTQACARFSERIRHSEATNNVIYQTYSAAESEDRIFGPLLPAFRFLSAGAGPNDGLVPVTSQRWTDHLNSDDGRVKVIKQVDFAFAADHLNETGWWDWEERDGSFELANPFAEKSDYEDKVKALYLDIAESVEDL